MALVVFIIYKFDVVCFNTKWNTKKRETNSMPNVKV